MKVQMKKQHSRERRIVRIKARVRGTVERPRLAVHRSLRHISAQIIDDQNGRTIAMASDRDIKEAGKPVETAKAVGALLAERAKAEKIAQVVFDRRDKRYHGRVKALADGAREGGLQF